MTAAGPTLLHAAQWYAELGYPVFPCAPGRKAPLTAHGLLAATTDVDQVTAWWSHQPGANIALRTDGLVVIDVDGPGNAWLADEPAQHAALDVAPQSRTPRGGRHYFFRQPAGHAWRNTTGRIAPHVDTRANGGYVLVAPSGVDGKSYTWQDAHELACAPQQLPEPPAWLVERLDALAVPAPVLNTAPSAIPSGERNGTLARLAGTMRRVGMSAAEILAALQRVNADRCKPALPRPEVERIATSIARYEPDQITVALIERHYDQDLAQASESITTCLATVEPTAVQWLWPGRFARGKLSLIAGQPGLGKSFLTIDIAARVSRGAGWPCEPVSAPSAPGNIVLLSAEDDLADTIRPRLDAAGADPNRVHAITTVPVGRGLDGKPRFTPFRITEHMPLLEHAVERLGGCSVVIIDPISSYLGKTDSHNNSEVRDALAPLAAFAARTAAAVIAVTHLNKGQHSTAVNQIIGSVAFVAAARAAYSITRDEDDPARRLMLPVKNNLGVDETGFAYRLLGEPLPRVDWEDQLVHLNADQVVEARPGRRGPAPASLRDACDWLLDILGRGPRAVSEVFARGARDGHTAGTLRRAKAAMQVVSVKTGVDGGWIWALPGGGPVMTPEGDAQ